MDLRDLFAQNLRRVRHERGLSQDDLAYEADVSRSYLSQVEKGSFHVRPQENKRHSAARLELDPR